MRVLSYHSLPLETTVTERKEAAPKLCCKEFAGNEEHALLDTTALRHALMYKPQQRL